MKKTTRERAGRREGGGVKWGRRDKKTHIFVFHGSGDLRKGFPPGNDGHAPLSEVVFE